MMSASLRVIIGVILVLGAFLTLIYIRRTPPSVENIPKTIMRITSPDFQNGNPIPAIYTCVGKNINPELRFSDLPPGTQSLALIMDDPDAPSGTFLHWTLWDIPPETSRIGENSRPATAVEGKTGRGKPGYVGPCPPSGTHRYFFRLYALNTLLSLAPGSDRATLEAAMQGHILGEAELIGTFSKQ